INSRAKVTRALEEGRLQGQRPSENHEKLIKIPTQPEKPDVRGGAVLHASWPLSDIPTVQADPSFPAPRGDLTGRIRNGKRFQNSVARSTK
ncbi:MAG: hypothetical protein VXZ15_08250, partial [Planctomycetota bacterium]|nr:hypothetical protein [Planctomycetota bacterium]